MSINDLIKCAKTVDIFSDISENEKKEIDLKGKIAAAIVNKRYELNMNQIAFAKEMGVSQTMVSKWESGDYNFSCNSLEPLLDKIGLKLSIEEKKLISVNNYENKSTSAENISVFFYDPLIIYVSAVISSKKNNTKISYNSNNSPNYVTI